MTFIDFRFIALFFIGIANAVPIPLTGSVLSVWLSEAGYSASLIGTFSLLSIPYTFKFLWTLPIDYLSPAKWKGCERKAWLLTGLCGLILSLIGLSYADPATSPWALAGCILLTSSMAGCVYVAGIAYELEGIDEKEYRLGSAWVLTGFRVGLLAASAGPLYLSSFFGWDFTLRCITAMLFLAALLIGFLPEPYKSQEVLAAKRQGLQKYSSIEQAFFREIIWEPCCRFFAKNSAWKVLLFILLFKFGEELIREMAGPFYLSVGFDKIDLANAAKMWGMIAGIAGAFLAAAYMKNKDYLLTLAGLNLLHSCTLVCYLILSITGKSYACLYASIAIENLSGGMVMTAFIAFLWQTCNKEFAAIQYTLLWSVYLFKGKISSFLGGILAAHCTWPSFFAVVSFVGVTAACAAFLVARRICPATQAVQA